MQMCQACRRPIQTAEAIIDEIRLRGIDLRKVTKLQMMHRAHRNIVYIKLKSGGHGSGVLISPNLVLTCAHNLITRLTLGRKTLRAQIQFQVHVGLCGALINPYAIQKIHVPAQYFDVEEDDIKYDYALIKLKEKVPSSGFISLKGNFNMDQQEDIAIYGYPRQPNSSQISQWGLQLKKPVKRVNYQTGEITYQLSTQSGQSGSPVIQRKGQEIFIIGVHKGSRSDYQLNKGKLLSKAIINDLRNKAWEWNAQMFRVAEQVTGPYNKKAKFIILNEDKIKKIIQQQNCKMVQTINTLQLKIADLKNKVEKNPLSYHDFNSMGNAYFDLRQYENAIQCFKKSIQIQHGFTYAYSGMGNALRALNKPIDAAFAYFKAILFDNKNIWGLIGLAKAFKEQQNFKMPIQYLQQAIETSPHCSDAYCQLANYYYEKQRNYVEAQKYLNKALQLNRKNGWAKNTLGTVLTYQNRLSYAHKCLLQSIQLLPQNYYAYYNLGVVLEKMGKKQQADIYYQIFEQMSLIAVQKSKMQ